MTEDKIYEHKLDNEKTQIVAEWYGRAFILQRRPKSGCRHCNGAGYIGRHTLHDIIVPCRCVGDVVDVRTGVNIVELARRLNAQQKAAHAAKRRGAKKRRVKRKIKK